jgi:hypothetical protein
LALQLAGLGNGLTEFPPEAFPSSEDTPQNCITPQICKIKIEAFNRPAMTGKT